MLVVLNGADHLRELRDLAAAQIGLAQAAAAARAIPFGPDGVFRVRTHSGCLIAR